MEAPAAVMLSSLASSPLALSSPLEKLDVAMPTLKAYYRGAVQSWTRNDSPQRSDRERYYDTESAPSVLLECSLLTDHFRSHVFSSPFQPRGTCTGWWDFEGGTVHTTLQYGTAPLQGTC